MSGRKFLSGSRLLFGALTFAFLLFSSWYTTGGGFRPSLRRRERFPTKR
jgi:hypothetical protein